MTATPKTKPSLATAKDLERLSAEGYRYELIRGELIQMPLTGFTHGVYTERLASRASVFVEDNDLGFCTAAETGYLLAVQPDFVMAPDWSFVSKARLPQSGKKSGYLAIVPDAVLETRSPNDTKPEVASKVADWLHFGVRLVWELNPVKRQITVFRPDVEPQVLGIDDTLDGGDVLPGFSLPIKRIFRDDI